MIRRFIRWYNRSRTGRLMDKLDYARTEYKLAVVERQNYYDELDVPEDHGLIVDVLDEECARTWKRVLKLERKLGLTK